MGRPKKSVTEKKVAISARIDPDIYQALQEIAKAERTNVNFELNRYLAKGLKSEKKLTR
jgi:hypothetical protein